jgi:hypothetical protein
MDESSHFDKSAVGEEVDVEYINPREEIRRCSLKKGGGVIIPRIFAGELVLFLHRWGIDDLK